MPISKSKRKKQTGQPLRAGRFGFSGFGSQALAFKILAVVAVAVVVLCLGGSVLKDDAPQVGVERTLDAGDDVNRRHALLRKVKNRVGAVRGLHAGDLVLLFGAPSFERVDGNMRMWQYASGVCALDVYFKDDNQWPVYAEYRVRGSAEEGSQLKVGRKGFDHRGCVDALYIRRAG